jgi:hypothetical protein
MTTDYPLYLYTLSHDGTPESYDETMLVACLQGLINRDAPRLYLLSPKDEHPRLWLDRFSTGSRWLQGHEQRLVPDLDSLIALAGDRVRGAIIWDAAVPATINVATTIAGVEDGVVLSPAQAERLRNRWPVLVDLRGRFTGNETGSSKNDAYRWAIREYLERGRCSTHLFCLYEDAWAARAKGDLGYVVTRDWAVHQRAFVFDLSPWGDEVPADDLTQPLGADLATYQLILNAMLRNSRGEEMMEMAGFFAFPKYSHVSGHESAHEPVPTEWETVYLISPSNCYQNTVANDCYNQSLHSQAPFPPQKQPRPAPVKLEDKTYLCILMADYDSTTPLYAFLPHHWSDAKRGALPLSWGINPNLIETYPDVIAYFYEIATPNDTFVADASCAGYMNPNRIAPEHLPLFVRHNQRFFRQTDMSIAPMVLDWDQPTPAVKDAFSQFAPDGFAQIVLDFHNTGGKVPDPHVWNGMPVTELINDACNFSNPAAAAEQMASAIQTRNDALSATKPGFFYFRVVWVNPGKIIATLDLLSQNHPELNIELVGPHTFFDLFKQYEAQWGQAGDVKRGVRLRFIIGS